MLEVPIQQVTEQMIVALPVYHPQSPDRLLLQPNFHLNRPTIERMKEMGVEQLWIKYPAFDQIERLVNSELIRTRAKLAGQIRHAFESIQGQCLARMDHRAYMQTIAHLIEQLLAHPASVICLGNMFAQGSSLMNHCLRVTYISVLMGMKLDAYLIRERPRLPAHRAKEIGPLGLGAMLHDVGLLALPQNVQEQIPYPLDNSDPQWRRHVEPDNAALFATLAPTVRAIILQHHQHYDGSGFPQTPTSAGEPTGMSGSQIHVFARIVTAANIFDRIQHSTQDMPLPSVAVLHRMIREPYGRWIDPTVFGALLAIMPAYSPGTIVKLSNGRAAVVMTHHADDPCRPTIQWLKPTAAESQQGPLDMRERDDLLITHVGQQSVGEFNFKSAELTTLAAAA